MAWPVMWPLLLLMASLPFLPDVAAWLAMRRYTNALQQTVTVDGRTERAVGTACREPDARWRIVRSDEAGQ